MTPAIQSILNDRQQLLARLIEKVQGKRGLLSILDRLSYIEQICGTLTERLQIDQSSVTALQGSEVWPEDLALFKRIVAGGILKPARFRAPMGYKILDFLTLLYHLQEAQREKEWGKEWDELQERINTLPKEKRWVMPKRDNDAKSADFSAFCLGVFNDWILALKIGQRVIDRTADELVEVVRIEDVVKKGIRDSIYTTRQVFVSFDEGEPYILHPMNIAI